MITAHPHNPEMIPNEMSELLKTGRLGEIALSCL
jgi:hypothetical protein